eukprot:5008128-Prymnesium_polylepis.2
MRIARPAATAVDAWPSLVSSQCTNGQPASVRSDASRRVASSSCSKLRTAAQLSRPTPRSESAAAKLRPAWVTRRASSCTAHASSRLHPARPLLCKTSDRRTARRSPGSRFVCSGCHQTESPAGADSGVAGAARALALREQALVADRDCPGCCRRRRERSTRRHGERAALSAVRDVVCTWQQPPLAPPPLNRRWPPKRRAANECRLLGGGRCGIATR